MRLPRMTTRWWMIAVAVAAVLTFFGLEAKRLMRLRHDYLVNAAIHQQQKAFFTVENKRLLRAVAEFQQYARNSRLAALSGQDQDPVDEMMRADSKIHAEHFDAYVLRFQAAAENGAAKAAYYGRLEAKYRLAARRPWLPVPPDPPEPQ